MHKHAKKTGCAVPVVPIEESIREVTHSQAESSKQVQASANTQWPRDLILKAYQQDYKSIFTDDASVVEAME